MSLTTESIAAAVASVRASLPCATITMRYREREYSGIGGTIEQTRYTDEGGNIYQTSGYVRLIVSELPDSLPKSGDKIQVKDANGDEWATRILTIVRKDEACATLRCEYGERYD